MEKNENGYPNGRARGTAENGNGGSVGGVTGGNTNGNMNGMNNGMGSMNNGMGGMNDGMNGTGSMNGMGDMSGNRPCNPDANMSAGQNNGACTDCLDTKPLAYTYTPIQRWRMLYPTESALAHGTLFEELYKPMEVYGNE